MTLTYSPVAVAKPAAAQPVIEVTEITDSRKNASPRVGTIRGGFGNPIKTLDATAPVPDLVRKAFADGLAARGMLAAPGAGAYGLDVTIQRLDSSQLMRREAHAHFAVAVTEKAGGRKAFQKTSQDDRIEPGDAGGVFGSAEDLRKLVNDSLQAAVDKALDDPALIASLGPVTLRPAATSPAETATAARLRELQALLDQTLITKPEYDRQRRAILGSL